VTEVTEGDCPGPIARARLSWAVELDAFRIDPTRYVAGRLWRLRGYRQRARNYLAPLRGQARDAYRLWIAGREGKEPAAAAGAWSERILPVVEYDGDDESLRATLESIAQAAPGARPILVETRGGQRLVHGSERIAALRDQDMVWVCPLRAGDRLAPWAFARYSEVIAASDGEQVIYSDDDLLNGAGRRTEPHLKPDWNPDLFGHHDYLSGACVLRVPSAVLGRLGASGWAEGFLRQAVREGAKPIHIRSVLHHRSSRPVPGALSLTPSLDRSRNPSVSVIIPTRDHARLLRKCLAGLGQTDYPDVETIVVDNGSQEPDALELLDSVAGSGGVVLRQPGPFNYSALNNAAVGQATGEYLCFLNNDVEMLAADWLAVLVAQAMRPQIGAVGARLLYPDGSIQHAGVVLGVGGGAGHAHRFQAAGETGYFHRAALPQQVSAVTGACLVVARDKFLSVGGFDEQAFPIAFNDVDLCLRLNDRGWQSLYEPRATLVHHESKSRGQDSARGNRDRFARELAELKRRWSTDGRVDPFHHPGLSPYSERFVLDV